MKSLTPAPALRLASIRSAGGTVRLPGSKSLSNRILLLSALAEGTTEIHNLLDSDDVRHMLGALDALGLQPHFDAETLQAVIPGVGGALSTEAAFAPGPIFLGNAGTAMRPLTAALAASHGRFTLIGEPRMYERPIGHLLAPLRELGATIDCTKDEGYPPLDIRATGLRGGSVSIDGSVSSQFLTALLMAAPLAEGPVTITIDGDLVSKPYILITLDVMRKFGIEVEREDWHSFHVRPGTYQSPGKIGVEGDASSASYFLALAAIRGGTIRVQGVGSDSVQGDAKFAEVLGDMGAQVKFGPDWTEVTRGKQLSSGKWLRGIDADLNHIPDAAMTIATTALFAEGPTVIRNVANWRVKETDRLAAMAIELRKVGATIDEGQDYIAITPPAKLRSAAIDTYDDHRMAMCFSLCACADAEDAEITINDPGCVSKTFPDYFEVLETVCG